MSLIGHRPTDEALVIEYLSDCWDLPGSGTYGWPSKTGRATPTKANMANRLAVDSPGTVLVSEPGRLMTPIERIEDALRNLRRVGLVDLVRREHGGRAFWTYEVHRSEPGD